MKRRLLVAAVCLVLCFSLAGCGKEGSGSDKTQEKSETVKEHDKGESDSDKAQEKPEAVIPDSIVGAWECVDLTLKDNGQTMGREDLEELFGMKVKDMASLAGYDDGTCEFMYLGETLGDAASTTWTESDGGYTITLGAPDGEASEVMSAVLKDGKLTVSSESSYLSDDTEIKTVTTFTFAYKGKASKILENWDLELSEEEVLAMNNYMEFGNYIVTDGYLYGRYGGEKGSASDFMMAEITIKNPPKIGEMKKVEDVEIVTFLTEHEGYVYGVIDYKKIVKVKVGETKAETVFEGDCNSMQIVGDKIYYTDGDCHLCTMNLKGENSEKRLSKAVYYPYVLPNDTVLYQDDADNESLHIYNLKTEADVKLNDETSYSPLIYGDYVYYVTQPEEESYVFNRLNLYSGNVETAPGEVGSSEFFIDYGMISFGDAGLPAVTLEEWDKLSTKSYGGFTFWPRYSNGEIRIYVDADNGVNVTCESFQKMENTVHLGYLW